MKSIKYLHKLKQDTAFSIECARTKTGSFPVEEFLEGLETAQRVKLDALIRRLHREGVINNIQMMRSLRGEPFFELKRYKLRIIGYYPDVRKKSVVLTHGFKKKDDKTPPNEIKKAHRIKKEYEDFLK